MARQPVIQVQCDRCKRVSLVPIAAEKSQPDFSATFMGVLLVYNDLCESCKKTVTNVWDDLREWDRATKQSLLVGPTLTNNQAAPMEPAPIYTPPQPHSAAGAKRS